MEPGDKMVLTLLELRTQVKMFHWQTKSYAEHKALDKLGDRLLELNDLWVESYQGNEHTRVHCGGRCKIEIEDWTPGASTEYLEDKVLSLRTQRQAYWAESRHAYLANILDEIIAALGKALYMLTLS